MGWSSGGDIPDGYEPHVLGWIRDHIRPGDVFHDLGAHRGVMSRHARLHNPTGALLAVEPNPGIFLELSKAFWDDPGAVLLCGAAWDSWSPVVFTPANHSGCGLVAESKAAEVPYVGAAGARCKMVSMGFPLDDLVARGVAPAPNLIKSDTQGSEVQWMRGATVIMKSSRLRAVIVECDDTLLKIHRSSENEMLAMLADFGFRIAATEGDDLLAVR